VISQRCHHCRWPDFRKNGHHPKGKERYCYWGWKRRELVQLKRTTAKRRLRRALVVINDWLRTERDARKLPVVWQAVKRKMRATSTTLA
jgi:hypothetical protein